MARLPDHNDLGARPIPESRARFVPSASPGEDIGAGLQRVAQVGYQLQDREDKLTYAKAKSDLLLADLKTRSELQNDEDWQTYEPRYREKMKKAREGVAGQIRSPTDRSLFEQDSDFDIERGVLAIQEVAKRKEVDTGRATLDGLLKTNRTAALEATDAATRTALIDSSRDALDGARSKGYINAQEDENLWQGWKASYGEGYLNTLPLTEQISVLAKPKGTAADFIAPDRRANLLKGAQRELEAERRAREAEQRSKLVEARQAMSDRLQDIQVGAQLGLPVQVPDKAVLQTLYGEREGAQKYELTQKLATLSGEVSSLQGLSNAELVDKAQSYRPTQTEGAAEQSQLHGFMTRSVSQILDAREKDPAGYLTRNSPTVQKTWQNFPQDPQGYLRAVRAEKERLGIQGTDVLPAGYAQQLADDINTAGTAEKLADRIEEESVRWGSAWPEIYGQLGNKLSDTALIIGSGIPKTAATALAATMNLKDTELKAMLPGSIKETDLEADVASEFADFTQSLPPEAARTANATLAAAKRLSIKYMNDGASKGDAVERAYKDLVKSQYSLVAFRGKTLRVPAELDATAIQLGAQQFMQTFTPSAGSLEIPDGAALTAEEYTGQFQEYVRNNGYWVTRPDAKGLRLYLDGGPVVTSQGPLDTTWEELATESSIAESQRIKRQREEAARRIDRR